MSNRGIKSDFDVFPNWVDLGYGEIKLKDFQVNHSRESSEIFQNPDAVWAAARDAFIAAIEVAPRESAAMVGL